MNASTLLAQPSSEPDRQRAARVRAERQHCPDLGNGCYRNPILAGNYGDPTVVRVGKDYYMAFSRGDGRLVLTATGDDSRSGVSLSVMATNKSYEASVEVECPDGAIVGLVFGNHEGLRFDGSTIRYNQGMPWRTRNTDVAAGMKGRIFLKIRNDRQDLSFFSSDDVKNWHTFQNGVRSGEYTIRLFAAGKGEVVFCNFSYFELD